MQSFVRQRTTLCRRYRESHGRETDHRRGLAMLHGPTEKSGRFGQDQDLPLDHFRLAGTARRLGPRGTRRGQA